MSLFPPPDLEGPFCTGMWQFTYHLGGGRDLVFLGGGPNDRPCPTREWGVGLLLDRKRDLAGEQVLRGWPALVGQVSVGEVAGSELLVTHESSIEAVVRAARDAFAQAKDQAASPVS